MPSLDGRNPKTVRSRPDPGASLQKGPLVRSRWRATAPACRPATYEIVCYAMPPILRAPSPAKSSPRPKVRDLERTRREILDVAFAAIYAHGFQGVSVDD